MAIGTSRTVPVDQNIKSAVLNILDEESERWGSFWDGLWDEAVEDFDRAPTDSDVNDLMQDPDVKKYLHRLVSDAVWALEKQYNLTHKKP